MMATNAIRRLPAPKTGGVRHPCVFCESRGYTNKEKKEQQQLLTLMSETDFLRQGNYRRERKLRKLDNEMKKITTLNLEMDVFFNNISLPQVVHVGTQTDVKDEKAEKIKVIEIDAEKLELEKEMWRKKEQRTVEELERLKTKLINSFVRTQSQRVPDHLWGHSTRTWTRSSQRRPSPSSPSSIPTFPSNSHWSRPFKSKRSMSKSFSIPFHPKPLHLMVRKAYLKPPPRLPPLAQFQAAHPIQPTARQTGCAGMQCAEPVTVDARELFADALERAVISEYGAVDDASWAEHPYYDDLDSHETACDAESLYRDDLDSLETVNNDEMNEHDKDDGELPDDVPWEHHPYYDTPAEEVECSTESDDSVEDVACHADSSYVEEEDEVPWEDSPYY